MEPKVVLPAYVLKHLHFPGNILRVKQSVLAYFVYRHDTHKLPLLLFAIYQSEMEQKHSARFGAVIGLATQVAEEAYLATFGPNNFDPEH